ncbi:OsmC family protein [Paractinoplanes durhamensis]|uniref:OsmC family protein n=1 Tax=Paractinoplanes durhamensis TaxID=113563 RepID=UPI0034DACD6E
MRIGRAGADGSFSPGELLQIATAGCTAVTTEELITRRAGDDARMVATVTHERAEGGREYQRLEVLLRADLDFLDEDTRRRVIRAMRTAVERQCTVSRTVERGAQVGLTIVPA